MNSRLSRPEMPAAPRRTSRRSAASSRSSEAVPATPDLVWVHDGHRQRVTLWPDVVFERETTPGCWVAGDPSAGALASATLGVGAARWRKYLEFVPAAERALLLQYNFCRMAALLVLVRCPALLPELRDTPALACFLAAHGELRGRGEPAWAELGAVYEREGIFGLLQWLGLPAARPTLAVLRNVADPDVPRRLLEPLRAALWEPGVCGALARAPIVSDEQLARACHALAA